MLILPCKHLIIFFYTVLCILLVNVEYASVHGTADTVKNASKHEFHTSVPKKCGSLKKPGDCENLSFDSRQYIMFPNGTVYIQAHNLKLNECSYVLEKDKLVICKSLVKEEFEALTIPCGVQLALYISVFSVFPPLFFSMMTEDVRDLIHVNWRGLISSVIFFHFLMQTVNLDTVSDVPAFRYTFPSLLHFFTLALLSWMTIISHDGMMMSESVVDPNPNYMELMRNFRGHILSIFTSMVLLITVTLITEVFGIIPSNFRPQSGDFCWITQRTLLLFFTGPVLAFSLINFLNFISTYVYFTRQGNSFDGPLLVLKKNYLVHFKLFVMVDITWLVGVLVFLTELEWLWRTFVGIFMFMEAFIVVVPFNKHLEKWVLKQLSGD